MPAGLEQHFERSARPTGMLVSNIPIICRGTIRSCGGMLVPCDPVITVAPDVLFFECFSKDESSYGCLTVERNAFSAEEKVGFRAQPTSIIPGSV